MAASCFLVLILTLFQSLLICPSSEEYFPSAATIKQWVEKMQNDLVTLARTASGVDQLAEIYLKNKNLYTVEANNARQLVESAATNIEKLLRDRNKALVLLILAACINQFPFSQLADVRVKGVKCHTGQNQNFAWLTTTVF
ncbi:hypothetical protein GDO78_005723 [Eleutherodactylus coqui]|uniref:Uncharacterized protein n=1 Tax=Eleutherodactylus coqui TaxID=57060 RepID=A0A8J6FNP1_ELECQ|nr:hypothetical protein GDO78_005723 [Eleutherodactylus coqui]